MSDQTREVEQLRARVAALEQLQEEHDRVVLEQSLKLRQAVEQAREQARQVAHSEEALRQQTRILHSILDSMGHGVAVADAKGRFLIFNPAARQVLGIGPTDVPPERWSEHFGLFLSDRATPYPAEHLPLARAMRGEEVQAAELFVRHAGTPPEGT